jgi:hypothetical protein
MPPPPGAIGPPMSPVLSRGTPPPAPEPVMAPPSPAVSAPVTPPPSAPPAAVKPPQTEERLAQQSKDLMAQIQAANRAGEFARARALKQILEDLLKQ